jgi:hypothetical protein
MHAAKDGLKQGSVEHNEFSLNIGWFRIQQLLADMLPASSLWNMLD